MCSVAGEIDAPVSGPHGAPAWDEIAEEIECSRCGYNLRGLSEPRCPECGLQFEWADHFDPARRKHPYLFEHRAHKEPIASFLKTLVGSLQPGAFWRTVTLHQPCQPRRLLAYWLLFACAYCLTIGVAVGTFIATSVLFWGGGVQFSFHATIIYIVFFSIPLIIQASTIGALLIFQLTLARFRVRSYHVIRCGVYAGCFFIIAACMVDLLVIITCVSFVGVMRIPESIEAVVMLGMLVVFGLSYLAWWWSLRNAYRHYLKIDRAFGMIACSQIIAILVIIDVIVTIAMWR